MRDAQFPLYKQRASSYDPPLVFNHDDVVTSLPLCVHPIISPIPFHLRDVSNGCQNPQAIQEADRIV